MRSAERAASRKDPSPLGTGPTLCWMVPRRRRPWSAPTKSSFISQGIPPPTGGTGHCRLNGERPDSMLTEWRISVGPDRYVAGEASGLPRFSMAERPPAFLGLPMAAKGPSGRPTLISNAETMAHLAFLLRFSAALWRSGDTPTLAGFPAVDPLRTVGRPDRSSNWLARCPSAMFCSIPGWPPPAAVLVGGYAGTWLEGDTAWQVPFERTALEWSTPRPGAARTGRRLATWCVRLSRDGPDRALYGNSESRGPMWAVCIGTPPHRQSMRRSW